MQIKIKKLDPLAKIPVLGSVGAACFDVYTTCKEHTLVTQDSPKVFGTGLAFEIPPNHVLLAFSRSGHGFNNNVRLANAVGVIDSDFRGELMIKLSADLEAYNVTPFERIAQIMVLPIPSVQFIEGELDDTVRGTGGFGSSGK